MQRTLQAAFLSSALAASAALAQSYPSKPIRIFTSEPGAGLDFQARLLAPALGTQLQQSIVIENRGGAGGAIVMETVAKAAPDGYTVLYYGNPVWVLPQLRPVSFDPVRDFAPVSMAVKSPNVVLVHPSVPAHSIRELIALAKASPGKLSYSSGGSGSATHLTGALFSSMAGVDMLHVPYKGSAGAMTDLLGNKVQLMFATAATASPQIKAGKLRALAVTATQSTPLLPGLPAVADALPGYESMTYYGMLAPGKVAPAIVQRLNQALVSALQLTEVREKLAASGAEAVGTSPAEFAAIIKDDMGRWGKLIKEAGIKEE